MLIQMIKLKVSYQSVVNYSSLPVCFVLGWTRSWILSGSSKWPFLVTFIQWHSRHRYLINNFIELLTVCNSGKTRYCTELTHLTFSFSIFKHFNMRILWWRRCRRFSITKVRNVFLYSWMFTYYFGFKIVHVDEILYYSYRWHWQRVSHQLRIKSTLLRWDSIMMHLLHIISISVRREID